MVRCKIILLFLILLICSCASEQKENGNQQSDQSATTAQQNEDEPIPLDNKYIEIIKSTCADEGFDELVYTNKNTQIFPLSLNDTLNCFLIESEINCGFPSGSCGRSLQIFKRKGNTYKEIFYDCGLLNQILTESNDSLRSFLYYNKEGYKIKGFYKHHEFSVETLSINNLNYQAAQVIARELGLEEKDLKLDDPRLDATDHQKVKLEVIRRKNNQVFYLYKVFMDKDIFYFLIDQQYNFTPAHLLLATNNIATLNTTKDAVTQDYPVLFGTETKVLNDTTATASVIQWKYSAKEKRYIKN